MITLIDARLLDEVCAEAAASPRRRKHRNFHAYDGHPAHRLLNAMQPDSYIPPHRHLDPNKDETFVVLRGSLGLIIFDDAGNPVKTARLGVPQGDFLRGVPQGDFLRGVPQGDFLRGAGGSALGVDIPHGTWHTAVALEADTVFLEAKAGPYLPLTAAERAPWAPAENSAGAASYLESLRARLVQETM